MTLPEKPELPDRLVLWPETIVRAAEAAELITAEQAAAALAEIERIAEHNDRQESKPIRWPWRRGRS